MFFVSRFLALTLAAFFVLNSISAQEKLPQNVKDHYSSTCGLTSMSPIQNGSTAFTQLASPNSFEPDQVFTVPVNAYLLLDAEGGINESLERVLEIDQQDVLALLLLKIKEWNDMMPRLQLELCNFHAVLADPIRDRGYSPSMNRWMRLNYPELMTEDPNESVQIFLTGGQGQNWGSSPDGVVLSVLQSVFFHEVGHYFGLYHTNFGTYASNSEECNPNGILLYPDNTLVENCTPGDNSAGLSEEECGDMNRGLCSGDLVADTPVDIDGVASSCTTISTVTINDQEYEYTPPWTNILRAVGPSVLRSQITEGQKERMLRVFLGELPPISHPEGPNNPFQSNFSVLLENSISANSCNDFSDIPSTFLYSWSNVNLVKVFGGEVVYQPVSRGRLSYEAINVLSPAFSEVRLGSNYIFDGRVRRPLFEVDRGGSIQFQFDDFETGCSEEGLFFEDNLNVGDAVAILRHVKDEVLIESPYLKVAADVNNSGSISVADAISLIRRILGETEEFEVPDFKMVPELAFVSDETFRTEFNIDPFTASWNFQGKEYYYLQDEYHSSYLGDRLEEGDIPNLLGFKHQFPSAHTQMSEGMSFKVVESGNIYQDDEIDRGGKSINLMIDDQSSVTRAERKVKVTVSLPPGQKVQALLAKFNAGNHANGIRNSTIKYDKICPEVDLLKAKEQSIFNGSNSSFGERGNCLFANEKGVFVYLDTKKQDIVPEVLFQVVVDVNGRVKKEDISDFLGEIDFSAEGANYLDLDVLIEDFSIKPAKTEIAEPTCLVYNPVRNGIFTLEILAKEKQRMDLTICDVFGKCNSYQFETTVSDKPEKFEHELLGLKKGIGYYWISSESYSKTGIAIIN